MVVMAAVQFSKKLAQCQHDDVVTKDCFYQFFTLHQATLVLETYILFVVIYKANYVSELVTINRVSTKQLSIFCLLYQNYSY